MTRTKVLVGVLGAALASASMAQESISHVGVIQTDYSRAKQHGVAETDTALAFATIFLQEVNHGNLPHSQAAFLERAASLSMAYADLDVDLGFFDTSGDVGGFDAQYITESHWVLGGGYSRFDIDRVSGETSHNIEVGRYLNDTSRMLFTYAHADTDAVFTPDTTTKTYGVEYKNVTLHPSMTTALTLDMKYNHINADAGSGNLYALQSEYHFALGTSVIAGVQLTTGQADARQYNLGAMQYLTHFFAVGAELTRNHPDTGPHANTWAIRARLLF